MCRRNPMLLTSTLVAPFAYVGKGVLCAVGFASSGPVAHTLAAGWQATQGGILASKLAGGIFAFMQSAAMGGTGIVAASIPPIIGIAATTTTVAGGWLACKVGVGKALGMCVASAPKAAAAAAATSSWIGSKLGAAVFLW